MPGCQVRSREPRQLSGDSSIEWHVNCRYALVCFTVSWFSASSLPDSRLLRAADEIIEGAAGSGRFAFVSKSIRFTRPVSRYQIGLVIAAGLGIGTVFTLFVVPAFYMLLGRSKNAA